MDESPKLVCKDCGHSCPDDRPCDKCGSDPMLPGDTLCVDCEAADFAD